MGVMHACNEVEQVVFGCAGCKAEEATNQLLQGVVFLFVFCVEREQCLENSCERLFLKFG